MNNNDYQNDDDEKEFKPNSGKFNGKKMMSRFAGDRKNKTSNFTIN